MSGYPVLETVQFSMILMYLTENNAGLYILQFEGVAAYCGCDDVIYACPGRAPL